MEASTTRSAGVALFALRVKGREGDDRKIQDKGRCWCCILTRKCRSLAINKLCPLPVAGSSGQWARALTSNYSDDIHQLITTVGTFTFISLSHTKRDDAKTSRSLKY